MASGFTIRAPGKASQSFSSMDFQSSGTNGKINWSSLGETTGLWHPICEATIFPRNRPRLTSTNSKLWWRIFGHWPKAWGKRDLGDVPVNVEKLAKRSGVARLEPVGSGCRFHERKATP